jgi:signal transduction histidine kinase
MVVENPRTGPWRERVFRAVAVAVTYFAAARIGLTMAFGETNASPVWPPTGVALAAVLVWGRGMWPAVFVGAFSANVVVFLQKGQPIAPALMVSFGIGIGNTLEAVVGGWLVRRSTGGGDPLARVRDVARFVLLGAVVATVVSATIGVTCVCLGGMAPWRQYGVVWWTWWLGDAAGALVVAPLLIAWVRRPLLQAPWRGAAEACLVFAALAGVALVTFCGTSMIRVGVPQGLEYALIPLVVLSAIRLGRRGGTAAVAIVAGMAVACTVAGSGPFAGRSEIASLLLLQMYLAVISIMALSLAASRSERHRAQEEMVRANEELRAAVAAKSDFVAMVSHELRTPLTVVLGYAEAVLSKKDVYEVSAKVQRPLEIIARRGRELHTLIENLLDISLIDRGRLRVSLAPIAVQPALMAAIADFRNMDFGKPVSIDWQGDDLRVKGDRERFRQIVNNLLDNAVKYSEDTVRVVVSAQEENGRGVIRFADDGIGIPAEHLPSIFDRFFQSEQVETRSHGGAGLGLAVAKDLLALMDGTIAAESEVGRGSTFTVSLPLAERPQ